MGAHTQLSNAIDAVCRDLGVRARSGLILVDGEGRIVLEVGTMRVRVDGHTVVVRIHEDYAGAARIDLAADAVRLIVEDALYREAAR
jgi:hypothetical protein